MSLERLNLLALGTVAVLHVAARGRLSSPDGSEIWLAVLVIATMAISRVSWRSRGRAWAHLVIAAAVVVTAYESLGPIIATLGPAPRDRWILAAEETLTRGRWPPLAPVPLPSWIVDAFSVAYVLYFALPVILIAALLHQHRNLDARTVMRTLLAAYYIHYALYVVMPVVGPSRAPEMAEAVRQQFGAQGGALSHVLRRGIVALERTPQDAFPSAHTSVALLVALFARRFRLRRHPLFSIAAAAIVCSTVVLGYHYVVDVLAALPVVWLAWQMVPAARTTADLKVCTTTADLKVCTTSHRRSGPSDVVQAFRPASRA